MTLDGAGFVLSASTFTHSGTLLANRTRLGRGIIASASVFNHDAGAVTSTGSILMGIERAAVYNLNAGTLNAQGAGANGV
ncbi:MAG: hypothetical protein RMJ35_07760, partial [Phycisphaerales bacterium]|nr:hypothetical protein [Phycisphaerales bacterium]